MSHRIALALAFGLAALATAAQANTYTATAVANSPAGGPCIGQGGGLPGVTSSTPVGVNVNCADPTGFGRGSASAQTGILGVTGDAVINSPFSFFAAGGGTATFDTHVTFSISNPLLFTGVQAQVGSLVVLHGVLNSAGFADATASFLQQLGGNTLLAYTMSESFGDPATCSGVVGPGAPCSFSPANPLHGVQVTVPIGVPVDFFMSLTTRAHAVGSGSASATADWGDTMSLPLDAPVFDLPAGVTANDPEAFIFDNRFIPPDAVSPVDEPPAIAMLAAGLAVLGAFARRRRASV
ncbi:MAG TPA: hypothetical protein VMU47_17565 [Caldimonas sp.]|nr:hypothetical protein [Caldimonas sp.]